MTPIAKDRAVLTMLALAALKEYVEEHGTDPTMFVDTSNTGVVNPVFHSSC